MMPRAEMEIETGGPARASAAAWAASEWIQAREPGDAVSQAWVLPPPRGASSHDFNHVLGL